MLKTHRRREFEALFRRGEYPHLAVVHLRSPARHGAVAAGH
ncbi:MAG TPA: hypothetical protein VGK74_00320 [Symbiobacteriaceae bacterium]